MKLETTNKPKRIKNLSKFIDIAMKVLDEQNVPNKNRKVAFWDGEKVRVIKIKK